MARRRKGVKREIRSYRHSDRERVNNPPVGLVTGATDPDAGKRTYAYDPHLDPQLVWAGKAEHTSFQVPTVSLHVHERIEPASIIRAVRRRNGDAWGQDSLFAAPEENPPMRQAVEFYRHRRNWTNRLVAGDSLLVMNSLLEKEGLGGQVQMIYIDPPYGIRYGSNFQPFVNKRDVRDGRDDDLTREPETIRAFRDTWELGIHSYLSYLRDRLLLAKELLHESGSVFVQIGDENVHLARTLLDEIFGVNNFIGQIVFAKTTGYATNYLTGVCDYILWYGKDRKLTKYRQLYSPKTLGGFGASKYSRLLLPDGTRRSFTSSERTGEINIPSGARPWTDDNLSSQGNPRISFNYNGKRYSGTYKTTVEGLQKLACANRLYAAKDTLRFIRYFDDFPVVVHNIAWMDIGGVQSRTDPKVYVVQTANEAVKRCLLMSTDPGDLVFDPTCGSGTTAYVAEQWGRRWITCDTSRVALSLAKQRLMTAIYDYYQLAYPDEGVGSGLKYKTVPHVTLRSIANNPDIREGMSQAEIDAAIARYAPQETLYDQPLLDTGKRRVTGPFTVEAVPAAAVKPLVDSSELSVSSEDGEEDDVSASASSLKTKNFQLETNNFQLTTARSGETVRQADWRDELLTTGIRGKAGQRIAFGRLEPQPGTRWLHAVGETRPDASGAEDFHDEGPAYKPQRVAVSFGPDHAPLEQLQVERAWEEARTLAPRPDILVFAAFQFDPEAAKDIDETDPTLADIQLLKAQMNADLLTGDLKRKRSSNESFWLVGQPDVVVSSCEFLVVGEEGRRVGEWSRFAELSGLGGLEEVNRLGWPDLFLYALLSQGRDVWHYLADQAGWDFHTGQYRRRPGQKLGRGVPAVSWNSARFAGGTGNLADDLEEFGVPDRQGLRQVVERLRGNRQIAGRLEEIAATLNFPIPPDTKNWELKTRNWHSCAVRGFDYFNTRTGGVESGSEKQIAIWMLDPDYDGRSLFPQQVFFPMSGLRDGWTRLARNLKAEIDEDLIEAYRGAVSLPFEPGEHRRVAVKIVDDRGIESLKVIELGS